MRWVETRIQEIRHRIFREAARMAYHTEWPIDKRIEELPYKTVSYTHLDVYKRQTLDDMGVKPIEAVGKPFDPNFHNAVMHVDDESLGENVVASELLKGYMYRDTVVRHSMVQVAN